MTISSGSVLRIVISRHAALASFIALLLNIPRVANAHISVDQGGTHLSRYSDSGLKESPCGVAGGTRGTNIYTYRPGDTITISIKETVSHPSYFRIAFDADGDDGFLTPSGTAGEFGNCAGDPACGAGKEDYCNNDAVLLDHLDPHASAFGTTPIYTWSVTLPDVECDNCTIQIIQVMNDLNVHTAPYPQDDVYYQCIDIVLSNSADLVGDPQLDNNGMECAGSNGSNVADAGVDASMETGGMMKGSSTGGMNVAGATGGILSTGGSTAATSGGSPIAGGTGGMPVTMAGMEGTTPPPSGGGGIEPATTAGTQTSSGCGCAVVGARNSNSESQYWAALAIVGLCLRRRLGRSPPTRRSTTG